MSKGVQPLLEEPLFSALCMLVDKYGIVNLVETGTGPRSSGLEAAHRLDLRGISCDVFGPCVERAVQLYPQFETYHSDSETLFRNLMPKLEGPTFFWLDGHCPTDDNTLPCSIFPPYEEIMLVKALKPDISRDVFWLDDIAMITAEDNPHRSEWNVNLGSVHGWTGNAEHSWVDYLNALHETHVAAMEFGELLTFVPR